MSSAVPAIFVAAIAMSVMSWLCWKLSRAHLACSRYCTCIAEMLGAASQADAERIARESMERMKDEGLWKSK